MILLAVLLAGCASLPKISKSDAEKALDAIEQAAAAVHKAEEAVKEALPEPEADTDDDS